MEMCDSSQLQIDLFVTNDTPRRPRRRPSAQPLAGFDSTDDLAPPTAPFARQARSGSPSRDSLASEVSDWSDAEDSPASRSRQFNQMPDYGAHVDSVTDLVLFEGEEEERTAAEVEVSAKLKKEGKLRRALSRRGAKAPTTAPLPVHHVSANASSQRLYESPQPQDSFEALPLDHNDVSPTLHESPYAPRSASFGDIGYRRGSPSILYDDHAEAHTLGDNSSTRHLFGGAPSQRGSIADLAGAAGAEHEQAFFLDVTEAEQQDLDVVAELARPGYPRLERILDDEVQRSAGKTMVACEFSFRLALVTSFMGSRLFAHLDRGKGKRKKKKRIDTARERLPPGGVTDKRQRMSGAVRVSGRRREWAGLIGDTVAVWLPIDCASRSNEFLLTQPRVSPSLPFFFWSSSFLVVFRSAGCGPSSLNTLVRNLVASRIDLKKVAKGDPRGQVSIVVEVRGRIRFQSRARDMSRVSRTTRSLTDDPPCRSRTSLSEPSASRVLERGPQTQMCTVHSSLTSPHRHSPSSAFLPVPSLLTHRPCVVNPLMPRAKTQSFPIGKPPKSFDRSERLPCLSLALLTIPPLEER